MPEGILLSYQVDKYRRQISNRSFSRLVPILSSAANLLRPDPGEPGILLLATLRLSELADFNELLP